MDSNVKLTAIRGNLETLNTLLHSAAAQTEEAVHSIYNGEQNAAIGTIVGLEQKLTHAHNLLGAVLALHSASIP